MNNMEIKQGDKVRILDNVPEIYTQSIFSVHISMEMEVVKVQDGSARIRPVLSGLSGLSFEYVIPTKYLIKVDSEAKEAKFKKGDKVRYIGDIQEHKGEMFVIDGDIFFNDYYKQWQASSIKTTPTGVWGICNVPLSDLEPDTKPTEQTEVEKSFEDQLRDVLNGVEHQDYGHPIQAAMISLDINYWDAYAADLAKEVALKVANKYNDPEQAAEYAVSVAKAVVEGLKRK